MQSENAEDSIDVANGKLTDINEERFANANPSIVSASETAMKPSAN